MVLGPLPGEQRGTAAEMRASSEPPLSRKKKCPLLLENQEGPESSDHAPELDTASRVPDEGESSLKTTEADSRKTEERLPLMSQSYPPASSSEGAPPPKTTEYRAQFVAWPRPPEGPATTARKSASMGVIAAQPRKEQPDAPPEAPSGELWNGVAEDDDEESALDAVKRGRIKKTEYKAKFRPFSAYTYVDGSWKKATRLIKDGEECPGSAWYSEVLERVRQADQYRARSHTGQTLYGAGHPDFPFTPRDRMALSPVSVAPSVRDGMEHPKSREGSTKKKHQLEKTTVRPKSAEPVLPAAASKEPQHRSPKRSRPRAPRDLPLHGHGDLSGKRKGKGVTEKCSPVGIRGRPRPEERVWLKAGGDEQPLVNGFEPPEDEPSSVHGQRDAEHGPVGVRQPPLKVPLTTVKSPEEVTGVRSPDPESWTVPLEIGKGLHWRDGRTPDGVREPKGPPVLLSKRLKESSLASQKDMVVCDAGADSPGDSVDL